MTKCTNIASQCSSDNRGKQVGQQVTWEPNSGTNGQSQVEGKQAGEHWVSLYYLGWSTDLYSKLDAYFAIWSKGSSSHCNASKQMEKCNVVDFDS